jgi:hypothetical protein
MKPKQWAAIEGKRPLKKARKESTQTCVRDGLSPSVAFKPLPSEDQKEIAA